MKKKAYFFFAALCTFLSCSESVDLNEHRKGIELVVLGTIQDAGSPQIGCEKKCCKDLLAQGVSERMVVALGAVDHDTKQQYLFEATPDFPFQLHHLQQVSNHSELPNGIFITHAHIGHYTGLMHLGKEAMNSKGVKVYTMNGMRKFLTQNGPWSQLVTNSNINLVSLEASKEITLNKSLSVTPFLVPHRDEYSETVGFKIQGKNKTALFIPDIDKWNKWEQSIIKEIRNVDYAFIDGTFYSGAEIGHRNIAEIPHPFIEESLNLFKELSPEERNKVYFIHYNHTNPVLDIENRACKEIQDKGFHLARKNDRFML
tara:strand:- start:5634 stop:6578 length:945 start_codon:yes stop_codon:yes gene_type:complete